MRRVLVTGSRDWKDRSSVWYALQGELERYGSIVVVHGACPTGADDIADRWAWGMYQEGHQAMPEDHPADWDRYGKAAGPIRNKHMVDLGADVCHAFPIEGSRGTFGCMRLAEEAGIPVINQGFIQPERGSR